jgi:hypothetical protein
MDQLALQLGENHPYRLTRPLVSLHEQTRLHITDAVIRSAPTFNPYPANVENMVSSYQC